VTDGKARGRAERPGAAGEGSVEQAAPH
jgi:hypothetical protein